MKESAASKKRRRSGARRIGLFYVELFVIAPISQRTQHSPTNMLALGGGFVCFVMLLVGMPFTSGGSGKLCG